MIGTERILWGSDYPHYEGTYPGHATRLCAIPSTTSARQDTRRSSALNAAELYGLRSRRAAPLAEKCGPTWDEVSVPLAEHEFPEKTHTNAFRRLDA